MARVLETVAHRLGDNYPYFHPLYAGQMLKPPHPVARAAYALAMILNPNNHARDGGRASSEMEIEAVRQIAAMFGWTEFLGHLTSSGTFANLEALWVAGRLRLGPGPIPGFLVLRRPTTRTAASPRSSSSPMPKSPPTAAAAWISTPSKPNFAKETSVRLLSRSAPPPWEPLIRLDRILALRSRYGFRVHVDAAYGGYFRLDPRGPR